MPVFSARAGDDDQVHLVDADDDALLDPSPYHTWCGRLVFEAYNTRLPTTCEVCARQAEDRSASGPG